MANLRLSVASGDTAGQITCVSFAKPHLALPKIIGMMLDMADWPKQAVDKLAGAVKTRRRELGLTQLEVWQAGGPSNSTLTAIESAAQPSISRSTLRKLDIGLRWDQGTAASILAAAAPAFIAAAPADSDILAFQGPLSDVPTATLAEIVKAGMDELSRRIAENFRPSPDADML